MCVVSNVGDYWKNTNPNERHPWVSIPAVMPIAQPMPNVSLPNVTRIVEYATKDDIEKLRKEMTELRELLTAAKKFDEAQGEPDCEMDEKVALIKMFAKAVGVDMSQIFPDKK